MIWVYLYAFTIFAVSFFGVSLMSFLLFLKEKKVGRQAKKQLLKSLLETLASLVQAVLVLLFCQNRGNEFLFVVTVCYMLVSFVLAMRKTSKTRIIIQWVLGILSVILVGVHYPHVWYASFPAFLLSLEFSFKKKPAAL